MYLKRLFDSPVGFRLWPCDGNHGGQDISAVPDYRMLRVSATHANLAQLQSHQPRRSPHQTHIGIKMPVNRKTMQAGRRILKATPESSWVAPLLFSSMFGMFTPSASPSPPLTGLRRPRPRPRSRTWANYKGMTTHVASISPTATDART